MRRMFIIFGIIAAFALTAGATDMAVSHQNGTPLVSDNPLDLVSTLLTMYPQKALEEGVYVGSEFCIACHQSKAGFRDTLHRMKIRTPRPDTVVNDYNQNGINDFDEGLDFNQISSAFDAYKPNAPILSHEGSTYYITIGSLKMPLVAAQGGVGWKQRYVVRAPVTGTPNGLTAGNYVTPIQYNLSTHGYVVYHGADWYDSSNQPKFPSGVSAAEFAANNSRSYSKGCIGCHSTGVKSITQDSNGEWQADLYPAALVQPDDPTYWDFDHDGNKDLTNVGCESCHGPGSAHILNGVDPSKIVNPKDLDTDQANRICGQCHLRPKSVPDGNHGFLYNETEGRQWMPGSGEDFSNYGTDHGGRWPDGKHSKQHHQQWLDFNESSKPTFAFHPVLCTECHEPHHNTANEHQIVESINDNGLAIPTAVDNDTLCLACHATHGDFENLTKEMIANYDENIDEIAHAVSAHTHHPYAPERSMGLSRCTSCHMPKVAKSAVAFDIHSHTFEAIPPEKTLMYQDQGGMPSSCAVSCHSQKANLWGYGISPDISVWNGEFENMNAEKLMEYFGPGGLWWNTDNPASPSRRHLDEAAPAGSYRNPEDIDLED